MNVKNHITRLSRYKSILKQFKAIGMNRVFANNLADAGGFKATQVRKDFYIFGITGNKKGGYDVDELLHTFEKLLGLDKPKSVIIVGYGRIGSAILNFPGFARDNIIIVAAFDPDPAKQNSKNSPPILSLDKMDKIIAKYSVKTAALCVPDSEAQATLNQLVAKGITGVLNFSSHSLYAPNHVFVNHVDLRMALETVIFQSYSPVKEDNEDE